MLNTLPLLLDHVQKVMMVLRGVLAAPIAKVILEIDPHAGLSLLPCPLSSNVTAGVVVVVARTVDRTLVCHTVLARAHANRPLHIML